MSSDTLYHTQTQNFYSNHLIMNSVMSDIVCLEFFKCVIWYPLLHSNPNLLFQSFNHELSHVWYPMTGVFLNVSSDTLYYTQTQIFYSNHLVMNSVMSDILRMECFFSVIWYPLLHSSPSVLFDLFNHESSQVWYHMTGFFLMCHRIPSTTLKPKLFYLNHLIMNSVMSDIIWFFF